MSRSPKMSRAPNRYLPLFSALPSGEEDEKEEDESYTSRAHTEDGTRRLSRRDHVFVIVIILQFIVIGLLVARKGIVESDQGDALRSYSPAQEAVEYEVKVFTPGRTNKTIYQGLSDEVDRAWDALYNHSIIQIPKSQAALLPNRTYPIRQEPGYYIAMLDVFHQLHCLNMIRQALHRDYYTWSEHLSEEHISHCVDSIRQSLMCNADISVNVWQWDSELKSVKGHSTQAHTCKKFEKLWSWTEERRMRVMIEHSVFVEDDIPDPPVIHS